ncbi:hypothetical protein LEMLEM_LOCUS3001, partial [Lemmus lemmus]
MPHDLHPLWLVPSEARLSGFDAPILQFLSDGCAWGQNVPEQRRTKLLEVVTEPEENGDVMTPGSSPNLQNK